ncbi:MAG TPA: iron uptake system protein EfeO [Solirubrobacteraceae bacterium]
MLTTFVIALREGLEASLIVGIVAAFLRRQGRDDALRSMWLGVGLAVALCLAVAAVLRVVDNELPHRAQEGLETVVALVAVAMVTYMIVWMTEHARDLRGQLQAGAAGALARGSTWALVGMAFFAVLREGFETSVFLLAAFNDATDPAPAGLGVVLGLACALVLGYGIYRGGVRLNLSRFFRATGVVLVLVAAGLVASALHSAAEAGWVTGGQSEALDLSAIIRPGTVWESLITGILGIHAEPTVIEVVGWVLYGLPMLAILLVPDAVRPRVRASVAGAAVVAAPLVLVAGTLGGGKSTSAAAAATAQRTVNVAITDAGCEPAALRLASGPATFVVTNKDAQKVSEVELVQGDRALAEAESVTSGLTGRFSLTLQPGRYELRCPGAARESSSLVVSGARASAALDPALQRGVDGYRAFLERETAALVTGVEGLRDALASGDLAAARRAYAVARVPYERVEPVAESFGELDPRIDARANDVPKSQWTGFHPIERRLWVQRTTKGTAALADGLVANARKLQRLVRGVRLEPAQVGNGANELLGEVSKSKITGEEERYSHLDLLDFDANVEGARAAFDAIRPALVAKDPDLAAEIERRFGLVDAALRPHERAGGFVPYDSLQTHDVRRLSEVIDALAEPLSHAPARALSG